MAIINEKDSAVVRGRLSKLAGPVRLAVFTQAFECEYCQHTRELVQEVAGLSGGMLTVDVYDLEADKAKADALAIDKLPAIAVLGSDGTDYGIRFFGVPAGYEFTSFLESLDIVSRGDSGLAPATKAKLATLEAPLLLQVFVTPTCPYCPKAVVTAFRFAMESKKITASMVEATEFPHLVNKYGVSSVPHTIIGDAPQPMIGAYPEGAAADMILAAVKGFKSM
jgi:glutaredoxin-like protein